MEPIRLFAITPPGVEEVAIDELAGLSAHNPTALSGGVEFSGSIDTLFRISLRARTITRILLRLREFKTTAFPDLFNRLSAEDWRPYFAPGMRLAVVAQSHRSRLLHTGRISETAIAAVQRSVAVIPAEKSSADQRLYIRFDEDCCTVSIDCSGERLDRRGYRLDPGAAPLRETIAAAIVLWSGWQREEPLWVPMCGSGTLAIEAAMIARRQAVGCAHAFPFLHWPGLKAKRWEKALRTAQGMAHTSPSSIIASDLYPAVVESARHNAERAQVANAIDFSTADLFASQPPTERGLLLLNPPYGERIGGESSRTYGRIGQLYRERLSQWRMAILVPDNAAMRALSLTPSRQLPLRNGGLRLRLLLIEPPSCTR